MTNDFYNHYIVVGTFQSTSSECLTNVTIRVKFATASLSFPFQLLCCLYWLIFHLLITLELHELGMSRALRNRGGTSDGHLISVSVIYSKFYSASLFLKGSFKSFQLFCSHTLTEIVDR